MTSCLIQQRRGDISLQSLFLLPLFVTALSFLVVASCTQLQQNLVQNKETITSTTTFTLAYDGLLNANLLSSVPSVDNFLIPYSLVETLATEISSDIIQLYHVKSNSGSSSKTIDLDRRCYRVMKGGSMRCALDYEHDDPDKKTNILFHLDLHVFQQEGQVLARLDATVTASDRTTSNIMTTKSRLTNVARNILIDSISPISLQLQMVDEPVWAIRHRPSYLEMKQSNRQQQNSLQQVLEMKMASLEHIIMSPPSYEGGFDMRERRRLDITTALPSSLGHDPQLEDAHVWEYHPVGSKKSLVRSLFADGFLRATAPMSKSSFMSLSSMAVTSTIAHAEAMIHPAMVSHVAPKRIALWSTTPQPLLREILKHTSVEHVTIVGASIRAVNVLNQFLPALNDCSYRFSSKSTKKKKHGGVSCACMDQPAVKVIYNESAMAWVDGLLLDDETEYTLDEYYNGSVTGSPENCDMKAPWVQPNCRYSREPQFDIIFIEIPADLLKVQEEVSWLNVNLHQKLLRLLAPESLVVINAGSAPIIGAPRRERGHPSPRDNFLRDAGRSVNQGGIGYTSTLVYEEPLSSPLPTTFIVCFAGDSWSYARFVQKHNPTSFDLDLIAKVYPVRNRSKAKFRNTPTLLYDGPTHVAYLQTPLAWEYWYCRHPVMGESTFACRFFLNQWYNASYHHLSSSSTEVRRVPVKGRTLFATQAIPKGHFVLSQDTALNLQMDAVRWYALERFVEDFPDAKQYGALRDFFKAYGFESEPTGMTGWSVSVACNTTFINHGCTEPEVNTGWIKELYLNADGFFAKFSPFLTRRGEIAGVLAYATRDIQFGEEIACDYRSFRSYDDDLELEELIDRICDEGVGLVSTSDADIEETTANEAQGMDKGDASVDEL